MDVPPLSLPARDSGALWNFAEAAALQRRLQERVLTLDRLGTVRYVAGADVAYDPFSGTHHAAIVVLDVRSLETIETAFASGATTVPYVPGFLSFRESPVVLEAWGKLKRTPDILLVDGHGVAHPRRFGIACHLGVALDVPSIGVAKSILVGEARAPARRRGATSRLLVDRETLGSAVRTREGISPVYVSTGHRVSLATAIRWVLRCGGGYRLPEPTRRAHLAVGAEKRRIRWNDDPPRGSWR
jgi:deoxyribonuclease V